MNSDFCRLFINIKHNKDPTTEPWSLDVAFPTYGVCCKILVP